MFLSRMMARMWSGRLPALTEGITFEFGLASGDMQRAQHRWHVLRLKNYIGIEHATIQQAETGKTKTLAVAAIVAEPGFAVLTGVGNAWAR
jgi:hypothetical protein